MSTSRKKVESLEIKKVPIASLHQDPANARLHPKQNMDAIKASLLDGVAPVAGEEPRETAGAGTPG